MECETSKEIGLQAPIGKKMRPSDYAQYDELVDELADRLKIARHPDSSITIKAARLLIEKLSADIAEMPDYCSSTKHNNNGGETRIQKSKFSLDDVGLPQVAKISFQNSDKPEKKKDELRQSFEHASRALKLLYLDDQKQLQFRVNEIISTIQSVTANPKTDPKLLATGR